MQRTAITALVAALSASAGVATALWITNDAPENTDTVVTDSTDVTELRERIEELEQQIHDLAVQPMLVNNTPAQQVPPRGNVQEAQPVPATPEERRTSWQRSQQRRENQQREQLLAAGWTETEIDELRQIAESSRLQALEQQHLAARALREEYPDMADMFQFGRDNSTREALGDEKYASYLEALGRPTAVNVRGVVPGSAGASAGLREGDLIRSYGGRRVFNRGDLEQATYDGEYGEPVIIEVERDGSTFFISIPRGPIGTSGRGWD